MTAFLNKKIYHISLNDNLTILSKYIPKDVLDRKEDVLEDSSIARVSFAPSIDGCILGLQISSSKFNGKPYLIYTVYEPINYSNLNIKTNEEIVREKLVFDAHITKELWVLNDIHVKPIYKIKVFNEVKRTITYKPLLKDPTKTKWLKPDGTLDTYELKWSKL